MRLPDALRRSEESGEGQLRGTRAGLVAAAFLAPFSVTHLVGPLTLGRAAAIALAILLARDLLKRRSFGFEPNSATLLLIVGYVGLCGWVFLSSRTVGCNCEGKASGVLELTMLGLLALVAIGVEPRLRRPALLAALAGLTFAALLALLGVGALNSSTVDLTNTGGRLSGTYGNANELGLAAALGVPIAIAYLTAAHGARRLLLGAALAVLGATLILTYSRGGLLACAAGVLALALWNSLGSPRRIGLILGFAAVLAAVGVASYSIFESNRESASFESVPASLAGLDQRDATGWDARALGPIPHGSSRLRNRDRAIVVSGRRSGEGVSFRWGEGERGGTYVLRFRARSEGGKGRFAYALGDRLGSAGTARRGRLGDTWRSFSLAWRPHRRSPHAALYVWQPTEPARFALRDVRVVSSSPAGRRVIAAPPRLKGSIYDQMRTLATRSEKRYVESRLDAARLAWRAFRSAPLAGIGWSTFPEYSDERLDYGRLAAHDQYLLIAAELGIIGLAFFALLIAAPVVGLRRVRHDRETSAALGVLVTAVVGMVFVEVLAAPQLAAPIAIAAAAVAAGPARDQAASARSRTSMPSPRAATGTS
jgi:O-antigen ligase